MEIHGQLGINSISKMRSMFFSSSLTTNYYLFVLMHMCCNTLYFVLFDLLDYLDFCKVKWDMSYFMYQFMRTGNVVNMNDKNRTTIKIKRKVLIILSLRMGMKNMNLYQFFCLLFIFYYYTENKNELMKEFISILILIYNHKYCHE